VEIVYGIRIIQPAEGEDPNRKPTASELLSANACEFLFNFLKNFNEKKKFVIIG